MHDHIRRYGGVHDALRKPTTAYAPVTQLIMNCAISATGAGLVVGVANNAYNKDWGGVEFGGIFLVFLLVCYGIWALGIRDNDYGSSSGNWFDL